MEDNNKEIWEQKDKRISFQSIFKTISDFYKGGQLTWEDIFGLAVKANNKLYQIYPFPTQTTSFAKKPATGAIRGLTNDNKPIRCPNCKAMSYYHNKGISPKSGAPYENYKCSKCKHIEWLTQNYAQNRAEDLRLRDMGEIPVIDDLEEDNYNARQQESENMPPEYR